MKQISILIKPSSSLCNMKCAYCFYTDVSKNRKEYAKGMMSETTSHLLIDEALSLDVQQINFCFQGGEPTLVGLAFYKDFVLYVSKQNKKGLKVTYAIQTNGLVLNDAWYDLFESYHFLVGLSLDGDASMHDLCRQTVDHQNTFKTIFTHLKEMEARHIHCNVLTVLTSQIAKQPKQLFQFYLDHQIKYVQLIPCLPQINGKEDKYALKPKEFFEFYKVFFDCWYEAYIQGKYISVSLFDQLILMYLGIPPHTCGMLGKCSMQIVVEGDGSVYPCDFYVLDNYLCGSIHEHHLMDLLQSPVDL